MIPMRFLSRSASDDDHTAAETTVDAGSHILAQRNRRHVLDESRRQNNRLRRAY
jgi:hypothetical protein